MAGPWSLQFNPQQSCGGEKGRSADSGTGGGPETRDSAGRQSAARNARDQALRSAGSDSAASEVCPDLHPPSSPQVCTSTRPKRQAPS